MNRHSIRYLFEHRMLPKYFFEDTKLFVNLLVHEEDVMFEMISDIFEKENVPNPYSSEDYKAILAKVTDDVLMLKLEFPKPEEEPLCYCAYTFFDQNFDNLSYFCIEKGSNEGDGYPFVCSWTPDMDHLNYGNCTFDEFDDFLKCADIHMEQKYGITREK